MNIYELKDIFLKEHHTIVIYKSDASVVDSDDRGVAPLMKLLKEDKTQLQDAMIADKVIGKAAALLMAHGKVKEVYTPTISAPALQVFKNYNILKASNLDVLDSMKLLELVNDSNIKYKEEVVSSLCELTYQLQ